MSPSQKAKIAFALALLLLFLSGTAAGLAIFRLYRSETLVRHTYDIEVAIGDFESSLTDVGRSRAAYVNSGTPDSLQLFESAITKVSAALAKLRQLTFDNPAQQALCDRLEVNATQRVAPSQEAVELKRQNQSDPVKQVQLNNDVAKAAFDTAAITQQMRRNEDRLLEQRSRLSELLFTAIPGILLVSFLLSACMFWLHYRLLNRELSERRGAENQLRQLSVELMRVQDEEHRRFARELHDGLGQTLAGAKMMADVLAAGNSADRQIAEISTILGVALSETRTISHLFHPPFLDEVGFVSAAKWLVEGYEQRTGVTVSANLPKSDERLPRNLELTLFRILQEALNNIQRHSKSVKAEVSVLKGAECVTLRVKDYGQGIPSETLAALQSNGTHSGIGLTGMKERVREQGGKLEVRSEGTGTEIVVKIPINGHVESTSSPA
jgi:signal transduction histidine kinase